MQFVAQHGARRLCGLAPLLPTAKAGMRPHWMAGPEVKHNHQHPCGHVCPTVGLQMMPELDTSRAVGGGDLLCAIPDAPSCFPSTLAFASFTADKPCGKRLRARLSSIMPADAKVADEALPCIFPAPAELAARDQIHTRLWPRFELGSYLVLTGTVPNNSSPTWNLADPTIVGWGVSRHAGALGGLPLFPRGWEAGRHPTSTVHNHARK